MLVSDWARAVYVRMRGGMCMLVMRGGWRGYVIPRHQHLQLATALYFQSERARKKEEDVQRDL